MTVALVDEKQPAVPPRYVRLNIRDAELYWVWLYFSQRRGVWGGDEAVLRAQHELVTICDLVTKFKSAPGCDLRSTRAQDYDLTESAAAVLRYVLSREGQDWDVAMTSLAALERLWPRLSPPTT